MTGSEQMPQLPLQHAERTWRTLGVLQAHVAVVTGTGLAFEPVDPPQKKLIWDGIRIRVKAFKGLDGVIEKGLPAPAFDLYRREAVVAGIGAHAG